MQRLTQYHPLASAVYFLSVLLILMFSANPAFLIFALLGASLFLILAEKNQAAMRDVGFYLLLFLIITLTNPLFSHQGATILFFINSKPITLESLLYGANTGLMLIGVMLWFRCFNLVFTSEKLLFLFGKFSPRIAILLTTALRFIPLLKKQAGKITDAQTAMGLFASDTWTDRMKSMLRVCSALITWALENAIDTGASMQARGYALHGKSSFSLFRFKKADAALLIAVLLADAVILAASALGSLRFSFYPTLTYSPLRFDNTAALSAFLLLTFVPLILEGREAIIWHCCKSKI